MTRKTFISRSLLSIITIILLLTTSVTSTVAWLQMNPAVDVDGMEMNITSGAGISVSLDNNDFFSNSLSTDRIIKAIVKKYKGYSYDNDENLLDLEGKILTQAEINELFAEIRLDPVTSNNGVEFNSLTGYSVALSSGIYVSFDLFVTTTSKVGLSDLVDVYFFDDIGSGENGATVIEGATYYPTKVSSGIETISLKRSLTYYDKISGAAINLSKKAVDGSTNTIDVRASDAMRFSLSANNQGEDETTRIYELSEGLGSYATDYSETNYSLNSGGAYMAKYDGKKSASLTYYNNKHDDQLTPISYETMPRTITSFNNLDDKHVCSLYKENEYISQLTFTFWLEGWDADCFDGIGTNNIDVQLTFTTKNPTESDPINVTFEEGSGENITTLKTCRTIATCALSPALPTRITGKKFAGWAIGDSQTAYNTSAEAASLTSNGRAIELHPLYDE